MKHVKIFFISLLTLLLFNSCQEKQIDELVLLDSDRAFAVAAAEGWQLETQMSQLAQSNGITPQVRAYGKQLVSDYSQKRQGLRELAKAKNISLPTNLGSLSQQKYDSLTRIHGSAFDIALANAMARSHQRMYVLFERQSLDGTDTEIKSWAAEQLPALNKRLELVKSLQSAE